MDGTGENAGIAIAIEFVLQINKENQDMVKKEIS